MDLDRLTGVVRGVVRALAPRTDALALYPATVLRDHGDMTVDARADSDALPDLVRVPVRLGLPGATARVREGARVLVGFEGGDETRPYAALHGAADLERLEVRTAEAAVTLEGARVTVEAPEVRLGAGARAGVVRLGDAVRVTIPPGAVMVPSPLGPVPNPLPIALDGETVAASGAVSAS